MVSTTKAATHARMHAAAAAAAVAAAAEAAACHALMHTGFEASACHAHACRFKSSSMQKKLKKKHVFNGRAIGGLKKNA
jgi:hypothetical protein